MKNKILLSTLLLASVIAVGASQSAFASSTSATQTLTGNLASFKSVEGAGTVLSQTINIDSPTSATLASAILPAFKVTSTASSGSLLMTASCAGLTGEAIFGVGTSPYIAMAKAGASQSAFDNTIGATPIATDNENVIAFPISVPVATADSSTPLASLTYASSGTTGWTGTIHKNGVTNTAISISGTARPNTFSYGDEEGDYKATILLSFT